MNLKRIVSTSSRASSGLGRWVNIPDEVGERLYLELIVMGADATPLWAYPKVASWDRMRNRNILTWNQRQGWELCIRVLGEVLMSLGHYDEAYVLECLMVAKNLTGINHEITDTN